jgi:hypothetical protein
VDTVCAFLIYMVIGVVVMGGAVALGVLSLPIAYGLVIGNAVGYLRGWQARGVA